jgi:hypothetical protein
VSRKGEAFPHSSAAEPQVSYNRWRERTASRDRAGTSCNLTATRPGERKQFQKKEGRFGVERRNRRLEVSSCRSRDSNFEFRTPRLPYEEEAYGLRTRTDAHHAAAWLAQSAGRWPATRA